jgi:NitT/TauT family transport system ATP-binding protein
VSAIVQFEKVTKNFGPLPVINAVSGNLHRGEIVSLVGPSGCGKSTLLRLMAGVETPDGGAIQRHVPPERIGFVFQDVRLLPWRTALQNVAFVLRDRLLARWQQESRARQALARVGLTDFGHYLPAQLSGGMQKRVAIARSLAIDADLILFDEPFADLDLPLRLLLIQDIHRLLKQEGKTAIYVTHDIREALTFSDRVFVLTARPASVKEVIPLAGQERLTGRLTPELLGIEVRVMASLQIETQRQMKLKESGLEI